MIAPEAADFRLRNRGGSPPRETRQQRQQGRDVALGLAHQEMGGVRPRRILRVTDRNPIGVERQCSEADIPVNAEQLPPGPPDRGIKPLLPRQIAQRPYGRNPVRRIAHRITEGEQHPVDAAECKSRPPIARNASATPSSNGLNTVRPARNSRHSANSPSPTQAATEARITRGTSGERIASQKLLFSSSRSRGSNPPSATTHRTSASNGSTVPARSLPVNKLAWR